MTTAQTSLIAQFQDQASAGRATFVLEQAQATPASDHTKFLVIPSRNGITFEAVSGSIGFGQTGLVKTVQEFITFDDATQAWPRYPSPQGMQVELRGSVIGAMPQWDAGLGAFVASQKTTCILLVTYTITYDLGQAYYPACPTENPSLSLTPPSSEDSLLSNTRAPILIRAVKGDEVRSLQIASPSCDNASGLNRVVGLASSGAQMPVLRVEVDQKYPPALSTQSQFTQGTGLGAWCGIRVYPGSVDVCEVTNGVLAKQNSMTEVVKDGMTFSGSPTSNLRYTPAGSPGISSVGDFLDDEGNSFSPSFAGPGSTVSVPIYNANGQRVGVTQRVLSPTEVAVLRGSEVVRACYGVATAEYPASYDLYFLAFERDTQGKNVDFLSAYVLARKGTQIGTTRVDPPAAKGRK